MKIKDIYKGKHIYIYGDGEFIIRVFYDKGISIEFDSKALKSIKKEILVGLKKADKGGYL